jgi:GNAT superfamily N-acetyltransferase
MPRITAHVCCPIHASFRVAQVAAMFDLPLAEHSAATFSMELPGAQGVAADPAEKAWQIGLIVGPSGSGKTTLAKAAYGDALYAPQPWPSDRAVIDGLGEQPIQHITQILTAVGLGSPPAWLRPYHVLSNGERFRCDLARALLEAGNRNSGLGTRKEPTPPSPEPRVPSPLLVFDEFTSVVDRTVAQVASAAIGKAIRAGHINCRFVAVTCHGDVAPWLEPDWVADLATGELTWGRLRRPTLRLAVRRVPQSVWRLFARHHYLSGNLNPAATCWAAFVFVVPASAGDECGYEQQTGRINAGLQTPVAFCAVVPQLGRRGCKRISRIVTLPDYQGLGIGLRLVERVCEFETSRGFTMSITASHPAILAACRRSPRWLCTQFKRHGHNRRRLDQRRIPTSHGRCIATFRWVGVRSP